MSSQPLKRNLWQRIFGICATRPPADADCWRYENGRITVDLARAAELGRPDGAIRLEKTGGLPQRVLIFRADDGGYIAFRNRCAHAGRRLDPMPGTGQVQCCSIGKSVFDATGLVQSGSARGNVTVYPAAEKDGQLVIEVQGNPG